MQFEQAAKIAEAPTDNIVELASIAAPGDFSFFEEFDFNGVDVRDVDLRRYSLSGCSFEGVVANISTKVSSSDRRAMLEAAGRSAYTTITESDDRNLFSFVRELHDLVDIAAQDDVELTSIGVFPAQFDLIADQSIDFALRYRFINLQANALLNKLLGLEFVFPVSSGEPRIVQDLMLELVKVASQEIEGLNVNEDNLYWNPQIKTQTSKRPRSRVDLSLTMRSFTHPSLKLDIDVEIRGDSSKRQVLFATLASVEITLLDLGNLVDWGGWSTVRSVL